MVDPEDAIKIVEDFKVYEELNEVMPEEEAKRLARSCLVHLFSEKPPQALIEFLRVPIGGELHPKSISDVPNEDLTSTTNPTSVAEVPEGLHKLLTDLLDGQDLDEDLAKLPPELGTFISGLQAGHMGRSEEAHSYATALPEDSTLQVSLTAFLKRLETRRETGVNPARGLQTKEEASFNGEFLAERDEVLAYCTNSNRPSAIFLKALAVLRAGQLLFLSQGDAERIFPDTGDLIAFPGAGQPRQPARGEIGVWHVAEHETEKRTHFHLASEGRLVYEARLVPFPSTDHDSVREYLKELETRTGRIQLQPHIFQLSDGLVVAPRTDRQDISKDEAFDLGLPAWNSLPAFRLDGRLFVVGPLPKEQSIYECGSLESAAKSLFRGKEFGGSVVGISKAKLRELAVSLGNAESSLIDQRIERVKAGINRLASQADALDALVGVIALRPEVKSRIDAIVEAEAAKKLVERKKLDEDIERLKRERDEWEGRVPRQRDEHKRLRDETSKVMRGAFEKARKEGVSKLLADAAIFQALTPNPAAVVVSDAETQWSARRPSQREFVVGDIDPVGALRKFGIAKQGAAAFTALARAVHRAGLMVSVKGVVARPAVEAWAAALGIRGVVVDVSVGLISDDFVRSLLEQSSTQEALVLLDANLSALDIYGRPLTDLAIGNIAETATSTFPATFLVLSEGLGALPVPRSFEQLSIEIDMDRRYEFQEAAAFDDITLQAGPDAEYRSLSHLWEPGARRLILEIGKLSREDRFLALSVLLSAEAH